MVRYADDFVVLARYQTTRLQEDIEGFIEGRMGLTINREKTRVVNLKEKVAKLEFLGFSFRYDRGLYGGGHRYLNLTPAVKSVESEKNRIRELTDHRHCFQPPEKIERINWQAAGSIGYFNYVSARQALRKSITSS